MTKDQAIARDVETVRKQRPSLTAKQSLRVAEHIHTDPSLADPLLLSDTLDPVTRDAMVARKVVLAAERSPVLFRQAPTPEQYALLQIAEIEKAQSRPATAIERLNAQRAAAELSPDDLLNRVPSDAKLPEVKPPTQLRTLSKPMPSDVAAFDSEIERRTGKNPNTMFPSERRRWHDQLSSELRTTASDQRNREAAAASVDGDFSKLSPAARITAHRKSEKNRA